VDTVFNLIPPLFHCPMSRDFFDAFETRPSCFLQVRFFFLMVLMSFFFFFPFTQIPRLPFAFFFHFSLYFTPGPFPFYLGYPFDTLCHSLFPFSSPFEGKRDRVPPWPSGPLGDRFREPSVHILLPRRAFCSLCSPDSMFFLTFRVFFDFYGSVSTSPSSSVILSMKTLYFGRGFFL